MGEIYKGHRIITIATSPYGRGKVAHVVYRVDRKDGDDWKLAREGKLYGPFDSLEGARTSAESVARGELACDLDELRATLRAFDDLRRDRERRRAADVVRRVHRARRPG